MKVAAPSIARRLADTEFRPSGFDYLRLVLAGAIIVLHSALTSYGEQTFRVFWQGGWRLAGTLPVPMFFALSGFLVAGSLERCRTLIGFIGLRVLRIVPALSGEIVLSALVLGPLLTSDTARAYFSDPRFWSYFANVLGDIHYVLPGLFLDNPFPAIVNGQLWTIPYELMCYGTLLVLAVGGAYRNPRWLILAVIALHVAAVVAGVVRPRPPAGTVPATTLVIDFVAGLALFRFREHVPWHPGLFIASVAGTAVLLAIPNGDRFSALPVSYLTIYLGLLNPPRARLLLSGDYSYGLYLYGYPLQQALASFGPVARDWRLSIAFTLVAGSAAAALSWWFIEKPALRLRPHLRSLEDAYMSVRERSRRQALRWLA